MKEAKRINKHRKKILNWFKHKRQQSSGMFKDLNNKEKVVFRNTSIFRTEKM